MRSNIKRGQIRDGLNYVYECFSKPLQTYELALEVFLPTIKQFCFIDKMRSCNGYEHKNRIKQVLDVQIDIHLTHLNMFPFYLK